MDETSGRATEDGPLSEDEQTMQQMSCVQNKADSTKI